MQITFDFESYAYNCYEIEENVLTKKLKAYDVTDIPDIATAREIVSRSEALRTYEPKEADAWTEAYDRFKAIAE